MATVSILIPLYNKERFIHDCLASLSHQSFEDFEAIIIDDGSTDNSRLVAQDFLDKHADKRFSLYTQENKGVSAAINRALELAQGEFILLLGADDMLDWCMLETLVATARQHEVLHVRCLMKKIPEASTIKEAIKDKDLVKADFSFARGEELYHQLFESANPNLMTCSAAIYSTQVLKKHGIRFDESISNTEDLLCNAEFFLRTGRVITIHEPLYLYRQSSNSLSRKPTPGLYKTVDILRDRLLALEKKDDVGIVAKRNRDSVYKYLSLYYAIAILQEAEVDEMAPLGTKASSEELVAPYAERIKELFENSSVAEVFDDRRKAGSLPLYMSMLQKLGEAGRYLALKNYSKAINVARTIRRKIPTN